MGKPKEPVSRYEQQCDTNEHDSQQTTDTTADRIANNATGAQKSVRHQTWTDTAPSTSGSHNLLLRLGSRSISTNGSNTGASAPSAPPPPAASPEPLDVRCIACLDAIAEAGCAPPPPPLPPPVTPLPPSRAVVIMPLGGTRPRESQRLTRFLTRTRTRTPVIPSPQGLPPRRRTAASDDNDDRRHKPHPVTRGAPPLQPPEFASTRPQPGKAPTGKGYDGDCAPAPERPRGRDQVSSVQRVRQPRRAGYQRRRGLWRRIADSTPLSCTWGDASQPASTRQGPSIEGEAGGAAPAGQISSPPRRKPRVDGLHPKRNCKQGQQKRKQRTRKTRSKATAGAVPKSPPRVHVELDGA